MDLDRDKSFFFMTEQDLKTQFLHLQFLKCDNFDEYVIINCFIQNNNTFCSQYI